MESIFEKTFCDVLADLGAGDHEEVYQQAGISIYAFLSAVSEVFDVLIQNTVQDPVTVLYEMLKGRSIASFAQYFKRNYTLRPVSYVQPLYKVFIGQNLPVFGEEYITGQLRRYDVVRLCNDLYWLNYPAACFMTFCREFEPVTITYCLLSKAEIARKLGFDFVIRATSNLVGDIEGFEWLA